jgi:hypothetical protein
MLKLSLILSQITGDLFLQLLVMDPLTFEMITGIEVLEGAPLTKDWSMTPVPFSNV